MTQESAEMLAPAAQDPSPGGDVPITERILDSAEIVLQTQGHAGFSTRRVAAEASIALGNLTYHFPTKSMLMRAMIDRMMTRYLDRFEEVLQTPGQGVEELVRWLLIDAASDEVTWLFRELWAMARHDETVSRAIEGFYDALMAKVCAKLEQAYPATDPADIRRVVRLIAMISEGSAVLYGTRQDKAAHIRGVHADTLMIMRLICDFRA